MPELADRIVVDIDRRLAELHAEMNKLQAAQSALRQTDRPANPHPANGRRPAPRNIRRRPTGTRGDQALALVRERPGITIPEIALSSGTDPHYLYRVMPGLVRDGRVRRSGYGWYPTDTE